MKPESCDETLIGPAPPDTPACDICTHTITQTLTSTPRSDFLLYTDAVVYTLTHLCAVQRLASAKHGATRRTVGAANAAHA